jgi:hypothetical protein
MTEWKGDERRKEHDCRYGDMIKEMHEAIIGTYNTKGMKTILMEHEDFINRIKKSSVVVTYTVVVGSIGLLVKLIWEKLLS